ncbi:MAG: hypothetical protein K2V38_00700 [Gemmataceae bacterium]|nr:hypothetical protein [Gemmataceae bacterium]
MPGTFHIGDHVRLKQLPGPVMLVKGIKHNRHKYPKGSRLVCAWYDKYNVPHEAVYSPKLLELALPLLAPEPSENHMG